jgi:uncharacterized membrane protein YeaQ/YmgE (transglycosylase-associated protein family)
LAASSAGYAPDKSNVIVDSTGAAQPEKAAPLFQQPARQIHFAGRDAGTNSYQRRFNDVIASSLWRRPLCVFRRRRKMAPESLVIWLVVGGVAGWLAGVIVKGYGYGLLGNIAIGILGSIIGGWLFGGYFVGSVGGLPGAILGATIGAVILLFALRIIRREA